MRVCTVLAMTVLLGSALLTGCATDKSASASAVSSGPSVNSMCACGSPLDGKTYTMYDGKKVGFCCQKCEDEFNAMSDTQKKAEMAKMAKATK